MKKAFERKEKGTLSTFHFPLSTCFGARRRSGFTLIEMLVVIVIIVILMGVVFRLSRGVMAKSDHAAEEKRVAILRTLIEEFHAEYSHYPPVPAYKSGDKEWQPVNFNGPYPKRGDSEDVLYYPGHYSPVEGEYFVFGLLSFFLNRGDYCNQTFSVAGDTPGSAVQKQWRKYNDETKSKKVQVPAKDAAFAKRVKPIVAQIYDFTLNVEIDPETSRSMGFRTGVTDTWGHEYVYISKPPYTTYLVFSKGPDNKYDEDAPGDRSREANRDNVYGNLGDN